MTLWPLLRDNDSKPLLSSTESANYRSFGGGGVTVRHASNGFLSSHGLLPAIRATSSGCGENAQLGRSREMLVGRKPGPSIMDSERRHTVSVQRGKDNGPTFFLHAASQSSIGTGKVAMDALV